MPQPVGKDQIIKVEPQSQWKEQTVEWQARFQQQQGKYYFAKFENLTPDSEVGPGIFIQAEKADDFKKLAEMDGDSFKIKVSSDFVYGQTKGDKNRWLVYHDKNRSIYQHRFIKSLLNLLANETNGLAARFGLGQVKVATDLVAGLFGDYLREFR